jgi:trehalose 6-phosphate synthase/phosphatase
MSLLPVDHLQRVDEAIATVRTASELVLLLDYDGTLVPIADRPELAVPDAELGRLLRGLAARPGTTVHVVSGRPRETLSRWFADVYAALWAEHAAFYRPAGASLWESMRPIPPDWEKRVLPVFERFTLETPGSFIERKTSALAWHYRLADPEHGVQQAHALHFALSTVSADERIDVIRGKKVVEARLKGVSKALAARYVDSPSRGSHSTLAIGDDDTDDELFVALAPESVTVAVGKRACAARHRLRDPGEARQLLRRLLT